jgi:acyl carrier protein
MADRSKPEDHSKKPTEGREEKIGIMDMQGIIKDVRGILDTHGRLGTDIAQVGDEDDLYQAGLTSHASVDIMLALEETFGVEFPDRMLRREVFGSVASISEAVEELREGG